jgi:hypothetical protein|tara:strand:- start:1354 stop:1602 length:249 start_codon:yes stop_codon:yes gene_type:complete
VSRATPRDGIGDGDASLLSLRRNHVFGDAGGGDAANKGDLSVSFSFSFSVFSSCSCSFSRLGETLAANRTLFSVRAPPVVAA